MNTKSFARKWSNRFLRYTGASGARSHTVNKWCAELSKESANCNWVRIIIHTWHNEPFQVLEHTEPVIKWLESSCMHPAFVKPRAKLDVQAGVQVWLSHQEDVAALCVCVNDHVFNMRHMEADLAVQNWRDSLSPLMRGL